MPRRPAQITQADIARALRAAKREGASGVSIEGGKITIVFPPPGENNGESGEKLTPTVVKRREVLL